MPDIKEKKYSPAVDVLRIISILSVVLIHNSTKALELANYDLIHHPFSLLLNQITRFAVPLFFLISAFVLELNYPQDFNYFTYLKKRLSRIFLPYLFWSLIYYYFVYPIHTKGLLSNLFLGESSYQLYFIPSLFIFYLLFPVFHHYLSVLKNKKLLIFLGVIQIIILSFRYYFHSLYLPYPPLGVFIFNLDIFILGMLSSHYQTDITNFVQKHRPLFIFTTAFLSVFITVEGGVLYFLTKDIEFFYSNWRPSVFIYTLFFGSSLFSYLSQIKINKEIIKKMATYSFFVYFIHIAFIEVIWKLLPDSVLIFPLIPFLVVSFLSYGTAFLAYKIPGLSRLTG